MTHIETINDAYSSRGQCEATLVARQDPTVYPQTTEESPLTIDLIEEYESRGFIILEDVFDEDEIAKFREEAKRLRTEEAIKSSHYAITEPSSGDVRSVFKVHDISPVYSKLASDPRLERIASYLLDDQVYIHQSRLNYKPGFRGKEFYWHSDFETWHVEDGMPCMRALSMSITLTPNMEQNGPLMLVPGSHKEFAVCQGDTPADNYKSSLKKQEYGVPSDDSLKQMVEKGGIVTATGKPGSVIIFDCNTMHGSNGNITPYPRSNIFFVYNALSNRVIDPFCNQPPRPEHICSRESIEPIQ